MITSYALWRGRTHIYENDQQRWKVYLLGLENQNFRTIIIQLSYTFACEHEKVNKKTDSKFLSIIFNKIWVCMCLYVCMCVCEFWKQIFLYVNLKFFLSYSVRWKEPLVAPGVAAPS